MQEHFLIMAPGLQILTNNRTKIGCQGRHKGKKVCLLHCYLRKRTVQLHEQRKKRKNLKEQIVQLIQITNNSKKKVCLLDCYL